MEPSAKSENPYAPPAADAGFAVQPFPVAAIDAAMVKRFRQEIHALGAVWIFFGLVVMAAGLVADLSEIGLAERSIAGGRLVALGTFWSLGAAWLVLGVLTCLKRPAAIYGALALSYLSLLGNVLLLNVCGMAILALIIVQAHRVIRWAGQLRRAGVPLTARPEQFA